MTTDIDYNDSSLDENGDDMTRESVGEILKVERERCGYSEKEVADRLHITMHYLRAIETDCYEKLPGTVFARGYIRSYAELLELDREHLVDLFNARVGEQARHSTQASLDRKRRNARVKLMPWLILALLAFGGGFLVFWAYHAFFASGAVEAQTIGLLDGAVTANRAVSYQGSIARGEGLAGLEPVPAGAALASAVGPMAAGVEAAPNSERALPAGGQSLIEVMSPGDDQLQLRFFADSWVYVRSDDSGNRYRQLHKAGDLLTITGRAPFHVLLGDGRAVDVTFNGQQYPVDDNIRIDNTARLLVGL